MLIDPIADWELWPIGQFTLGYNYFLFAVDKKIVLHMSQKVLQTQLKPIIWFYIKL